MRHKTSGSASAGKTSSRTIEMAALIAWLPVVRVDDLVKDRRPPKAAALRAVLDKIVNANKTLSMRSRPLSGPSNVAGAGRAGVNSDRLQCVARRLVITAGDH